MKSVYMHLCVYIQVDGHACTDLCHIESIRFLLVCDMRVSLKSYFKDYKMDKNWCQFPFSFQLLSHKLALVVSFPIPVTDGNEHLVQRWCIYITAWRPKSCEMMGWQERDIIQVSDSLITQIQQKRSGCYWKLRF